MEKKPTFTECREMLTSMAYDLATQIVREHPEQVERVNALSFVTHLVGQLTVFEVLAAKIPQLECLTENFLPLMELAKAGYLMACSKEAGTEEVQ